MLYEFTMNGKVITITRPTEIDNPYKLYHHLERKTYFKRNSLFANVSGSNLRAKEDREPIVKIELFDMTASLQIRDLHLQIVISPKHPRRVTMSTNRGPLSVGYLKALFPRKSPEQLFLLIDVIEKEYSKITHIGHTPCAYEYLFERKKKMPETIEELFLTFSELFSGQ